ncbi:MAG TPA: CaiB/BaiF CoA-transferase family protein [Ramlibacter sp.]|nr:CaiB/BaiF CoA-transferase family protein [Ramlibacter sp.]
MLKFLTGLRVLENGLLLNGGLFGMMLADLGAEVIKIEDTGRGDYLRDILGQVRERESPAHLQVNKGKKSVALDVRAVEGRELFYQLLQTADVFIDGLRPGACDGLGIGYLAQAAAKPDIVYVQYTGFGAQGPYANIPTHGYHMNALAGGLPARMDEAGRLDRVRGVQYLGGTEESSAGTILGAHYATMATLAAVYRRDRTGEGAYIDVAASDAVIAASWMGVTYHNNYERIATFEGLDRRGQNHGTKWPTGSTRYQFYRAQDGKNLLMGCIEPKFWTKFCQAVGRDELSSTIRAEMGVDYGEDKPELRAILQEIFGQRPLAEWMKMAADLGLPIGPAHDMDDVFDDAHVKFRGMRLDNGEPGTAGFTYSAFPALVSNAAQVVPERAPLHGQHTEQVLQSLDVPAERIEQLRAKRVIK